MKNGQTPQTTDQPTPGEWLRAEHPNARHSSTEEAHGMDTAKQDQPPGTTPPLTLPEVDLVQTMAEFIADECHCAPTDEPPCCADCACWKEALANAR